MKKVAITGITGMIGSYLEKYFSKRGYEVKGISRSDINNLDNLIACLDGVDIVINLAGKNITSGRWSKKQKRLIYESRIETTKTLVSAMNVLSKPPELLISASASGYYGIDAQENKGEQEKSGEDFLATLCRDWEKQANNYKGGRVVNARIGVVLSKDGGMLAKLIKLAKIGILSVIGDGSQKITCIALEDLASIFELFIENKNTEGPFNVCTLEPITNKEATVLIAKKYNKRLFFSIPKLVVRFVFGQMGDSLLLANQSIYPKKLIELDYQYKYENFVDYIANLDTASD